MPGTTTMSMNSTFSTDDVTDSQRYVLALVRTVSGSFSLLCSSIIIYKICLRNKQQKAAAAYVQESRRSITAKRGSNTYYRMLYMTSVIDIMYSFWSALSVLPVPKEFGGVYAYGNVATCMTQSFFIQAGNSVVLYMASLNVYFMLKIRYNIPDAVIERRYEIWLHTIPVGIWLITGVAGLSLKIFGPLPLPGVGCWIGHFPQGCLLTNSCILGSLLHDHRELIIWTFSFMWLFLCFFVVLVNSLLIYSAIRKQERRNEQYLASKIQNEGSSHCAKSFTNPFSVTEPSLPDFDFLSQNSRPLNVAVSADDALATSDPHEKPVSAPPEDETRAIVPLATSANSSDFPVLNNEESANNIGLNSTKTAAAVSQASFHRHAQFNARRIKQSRTAAVQSTCYILSALFVAVWTFLPWVGYKRNFGASVRFFFAFMGNIVSPSQGIFNLFIFVRLQYIHLRESNTEWSRFHCFKHCLFTPA